MSEPDQIPAEWRERSPMMTPAGWRTLQRLRQHPNAPRWNFETGDRLIDGDLAVVDAFRGRLSDRSALASAAEAPPVAMIEEVLRLRTRSWYVERQVPLGLDLERDWAAIPTMTRDDLASRLAEVVPHDIEDFSRLLSYDTSGTSGHAVAVPHDPVVLAKAHTFAEIAMERHGAAASFSADEVGVLNLCAQQHTYVFASIFTVWNEAGFVKANLNERDWSGGRDAARDYLTELGPQLVTSDPISLAEAMNWSIPLRPRAIISTAVALAPKLRSRYAAWFECPVIDWYSTTETGPIAFSAPDGDGWEILPHDIFVEVVDDAGQPRADGEVGEVCVTTLRNPFLPLLRYRTGDFASLERGSTPRLRELHGRTPVFFRASDGAVVSSVDIGRAMRLVATFAQHAFRQREDGSCEVRIRPLAELGVDRKRIAQAIATVLGSQAVDVVLDDELGSDGKVVAYQSELQL